MNEWTNKQTMNKRTNEWCSDECTGGWVDREMDRQTDGWIDDIAYDTCMFRCVDTVNRHIHSHMHACLLTHMHTCTCTCARSRTHTHTHTHTHTACVLWLSYIFAITSLPQMCSTQWLLHSRLELPPMIVVSIHSSTHSYSLQTCIWCANIPTTMCRTQLNKFQVTCDLCMFGFPCLVWQLH